VCIDCHTHTPHAILIHHTPYSYTTILIHHHTATPPYSYTTHQRYWVQVDDKDSPGGTCEMKVEGNRLEQTGRAPGTINRLYCTHTTTVLYSYCCVCSLLTHTAVLAPSSYCYARSLLTHTAVLAPSSYCCARSLLTHTAVLAPSSYCYARLLLILLCSLPPHSYCYARPLLTTAVLYSPCCARSLLTQVSLRRYGRRGSALYSATTSKARMP
jgi:hypothetical protein